MCHCGDNFCDMEKDARAWANEEFTRLINSEEWKTKYPNGFIREDALDARIRREVISRFGLESTGFKWRKKS